jgi:site-specific recombinase XerC
MYGMTTTHTCKGDVKKVNQSYQVPKNDQIDPPAVRAIECAELRQAGREERLSLRDRTIYAFLRSSGFRCSELAEVDSKDVDIANRTVTVLGKGSRPGRCIFPRPATPC